MRQSYLNREPESVAAEQHPGADAGWRRWRSAACVRGIVVAMNLETTAEELFHTIFPHPTISETMKEAVLDANGRVLNM